MGIVLNLAAYTFHKLENLESLRARIEAYCLSTDMRGTVILASEGVNFSVAGTRGAVDGFKALLESLELRGFLFKESESEGLPFRRMKVRIRPEAIPGAGAPGEGRRGKCLSPETLRDLLAAGEDCLLLDTRNAFEVEYGTFEGARHLGLVNFRDFAQAAEALPEEWKGRRVVTFCTGGIRCEKASLVLEDLGFRDVYQLEGGILKYFEDCGGEHWKGSCFVFDERVAVDPSLKGACRS